MAMMNETMESVNREYCENNTVESWAAWFEGEEGWGADSDDDDDSSSSSNDDNDD